MRMLKMAATLAVIGGIAAFGSHHTASAAADAVAAEPSVAAKKQTLTVTVVGSSPAARFTNCQYTAYVSGGTPPYHYSWIGTGLVDGYNSQTATYNFQSYGNTIVWVDVEDALSDTGSGSKGVTVLSSGSC
jgi:hypothetical protein